MEGNYCYRYPRPGFTADCVIFRINNSLEVENQLEVLLIERGNEPFKGAWALPGGYVEEYENLEHAAARELREETGLVDLQLHFLGIYGEKGRDPRGWTVTGAFWALESWGAAAVAGDDAVNARWFPVSELPACAFDHLNIINDALPFVQERFPTLFG